MPEVTVSILTYTQVAFARRCIHSILHGGEEVALILTSNGNPEAAAYFAEVAKTVPNVTVVVNEANEGFWKPNNHALTLCNTPFFAMVNDDVSVPHGWLDILKKPFHQFPDDSVFSGPDDGCSELTSSFHGKIGRKEYVEGAVLLAKTSIIKKHGLFDPMPGAAYAEDSNASLKFRELGYRLHWVPLRVTHARGATSRHLPEARIWQELNHAYCRKRWAHYLTFRKFDYPIIVRRRGAFGDVLLATPIIRSLRSQFPNNPIFFETICGAVFDRNPHVARVGERFNDPAARIIVLDGSYEADPETNFVETYAKIAGVALDSNRTELYPSDRDFAFGESTIEGEKWIAIHVGPTWAAKMWSVPKWVQLADWLLEQGYRIVQLGTPQTPVIRATLDLRGKTTMHQMAAVIKRCELFIGIDSFPMHVAQAMGTPVVALFGVTRPEPIVTSGSPVYAVCSDQHHPGTGLRHKVRGSTFTPSQDNPMDTIEVDSVKAAVAALLKVDV